MFFVRKRIENSGQSGEKYAGILSGFHVGFGFVLTLQVMPPALLRSEGQVKQAVIGNIFAIIYYLALFLKGKTALSVKFRDFRPSGRIFREVLKIGLPNSISQIAMSFSNIILNNLA